MSENINTNNGASNNVDINPGSSVDVFCRVRPPNEAEKAQNGTLCVNVKSDQCIEIVGSASGDNDLESKDRTFYLDHIFPMDTMQSNIYKTAAKPIVDKLFKGINGTVLAYGQTSSGKTYTMEGVIENEDNMGVIPRMVRDVFNMIGNSDEHIEFQLKVSICEVYMERIRDLLDKTNKKNNLRIHEDKVNGIYVKDLTEYYVTSPSDVFDLLELGHKNRSVASTNMNSYSSRSHLIFILHLQQKNTFDSSIKSARLFLVDLAGSEKISKTGAEGLTLEEAKTINKSLSCLGNVINALTSEKKVYIPYRDSKLTRILQNSLGGNSMTSLIVTCSPSILNEAEIISTLRFGLRAKMVKNTPKVNQQYSAEQLQVLLNAAQKKILEKDAYIKVLLEQMQKVGVEIPNLSKVPEDETNAEKQKPSQDISYDDSQVGELEDAKKQLKEKSEEITSLKQNIDSLSSDLKKVTIDKDKLNIKLGDLTAELEKIKYLHQEQLEQTKQTKLEANSFKSDLEQLKIKTSGLYDNSADFTVENKGISGNTTKNNLDIDATIDSLKNATYLVENLNEKSNEETITKIKGIIDENIHNLVNYNGDIIVNSPNNLGKTSVNDMINKISQLDINMTQLNKLYEKLTKQNDDLKTQKEIQERRLHRKEERINQLEKALIDAKSKYTKLFVQCTALSKTIEDMSKLRPIFAKLSPNIVKGIQGGTVV